MQELIALGSNEQFLDSELEKYPRFKSNYIKWLSDLLKIPKKEISSVFVDSQPKNTLLIINDFIYTITQILTLTEEYKPQPPNMFIHPTESPKILTEEDFNNLIKAQLQWQIRQNAIEDANIQHTIRAEEIRDESDRVRRGIFCCYGLEDPDGTEII